MPPIPAHTLPRPIQTQMDALRKEYHSLDSLISRLKNLSGDTLSVQQELARSAREESKAIEAKIEELRLLSDEQDRESDRTLILNMLEKIETQFRQQQQSLRQAILTSKQTIDRETKTERELLFGGSKSAIELSQLRRRDDSSKTLKSTVNEYQTYDEVLKRGKNLITKLNQADFMDRLLIGFGLFVFLLVVAYILKKRIADRSISLVGYLFMPIRWLFSLLVPSLRTPPLSPSPTPSVVKTVAEEIVRSTTTELAETLGNIATATAVLGQKASNTILAKSAYTSSPQGILGILDALVGEHGLDDEDTSYY
ncbi:Vesicle transport protein S20 [Entomortierella lignicola]|nr:Vesicle transport protein S20 [Entomortierella lignicola]